MFMLFGASDIASLKSFSAEAGSLNPASIRARKRRYSGRVCWSGLGILLSEVLAAESSDSDSWVFFLPAGKTIGVSQLWQRLRVFADSFLQSRNGLVELPSVTIEGADCA